MVSSCSRRLPTSIRTSPTRSNNARFTFQVQDDAGTAVVLGAQGADTDPTPNTMTLAITPVNDRPTTATKAISIVEDQAGGYTFTSGDFAFNDPSDTIPPSSVQPHQLNAIIVNAPTSGTLKVGATTVSGTTTVSLAQLQGNQLVYTPAPNFNGSATLNFQVQDNGGTNFGGQDTSLAGTSIAFTVNSVNDSSDWRNNTAGTRSTPRKTRSIRSRSPTSASPIRMTRRRITSSTYGSSPARPTGR